MLNILLIDDDIIEEKILELQLRKAGFNLFHVEHVTKCSEALKSMLSQRFDIILLDNSLADSISAEFSVPFIKENLQGACLIIISNDTERPHLKDPDILGVDYIVNKLDLSNFMLRLMPLYDKGKVSKAS